MLSHHGEETGFWDNQLPKSIESEATVEVIRPCTHGFRPAGHPRQCAHELPKVAEISESKLKASWLEKFQMQLPGEDL